MIRMPASSKASLIRQRSSRSTANCWPGIVFAEIFTVIDASSTSSRPSTSTGPHRRSSHGDSFARPSATCLTTSRTRVRLSDGLTWTVTPAVAQPWLRLPIRLISPLRTYQISPLSPRSLVTRRPTSTTSPEATPASILSPTPYWSSRIMNTPDRKSVTRFRAPKPIATPATPALASSGPRLMPRAPSTISPAVPRIRNEATERRTEPIASERCRRRSALTSSPPRAMPSTASAPRFIRVISLVSDLRTSERSAAAITRISRIFRLRYSHPAQFSSMKLAAFVTLSWASLTEAAGSGLSAARGSRAACQGTTGTSRCSGLPADRGTPGLRPGEGVRVCGTDQPH